jgi:hypothetical protein
MDAIRGQRFRISTRGKLNGVAEFLCDVARYLGEVQDGETTQR